MDDDDDIIISLLRWHVGKYTCQTIINILHDFLRLDMIQILNLLKCFRIVWPSDNIETF